MARNNKEKDMVFSSEKYENRVRLIRILIPAAAVVLVVAIAIGIAFAVRASKGIKYTGGEDTAYPYSWRNSRKGVITLDISRSADPERHWVAVNPDITQIEVSETKKQPEDATRFTAVPKETGRKTLIFIFMDDKEEGSVKMEMLLDTTVNEKGTLTTEVISASLLERQTRQSGGEGSYYPYTFQTNEEGFLQISIGNASGVAVYDWVASSDNEEAATVEGMLFLEEGIGVYMLPGTQPGLCRLTVSSEAAAAVMTMEIENTDAGVLMVRSHSMEGGTTIPVIETGETDEPGGQEAPGGESTQVPDVPAEVQYSEEALREQLQEMRDLLPDFFDPETIIPKTN